MIVSLHYRHYSIGEHTVNKECSDIALMLQVKSGTEEAFEILHSRYQRKVIAFFWGLIRDAQLALMLPTAIFVDKPLPHKEHVIYCLDI